MRRPRRSTPYPSVATGIERTLSPPFLERVHAVQASVLAFVLTSTPRAGCVVLMLAPVFSAEPTTLWPRGAPLELTRLQWRLTGGFDGGRASLASLCFQPTLTDAEWVGSVSSF